jgi:hypothetical protein
VAPADASAEQEPLHRPPQQNGQDQPDHEHDHDRVRDVHEQAAHEDGHDDLRDQCGRAEEPQRETP